MNLTMFDIRRQFWTLGYDTIYGFQDIKDDEIIGVKSTSIKFMNQMLLIKEKKYVTYLLKIKLIINISKEIF